MGSGSSLVEPALLLNLSLEQRLRYKEMYTRLKSEGKSEDEIKEIINTLIQTESAAEKSKRIRSDRVRPSLENKVTSGEVPKSASSRRRSTFDPDHRGVDPSSGRRMTGLNKSNSKNTLKSSKSTPSTAIETPIAASADDFALSAESLALLTELAAATVPWKSTDPEKPFGCELCRTAFKTNSQLEQHVKFSYLHAKAVADKSDVNRLTEQATKLATVMHRCIRIIKQSMSREIGEEVLKTKSKAVQRWFWAFKKVRMQNDIVRTAQYLVTAHVSTKAVAKPNVVVNTKQFPEGVVIFEGNKFFWRCQETMTMHVCMHNHQSDIVNGAPQPTPLTTSASTPVGASAVFSTCLGPETLLEIIVYDPKRLVELPRLYLRHRALFILLKEEIAAALVEREKREKANKVLEYEGESLVNRGKSTKVKVEEVDIETMMKQVVVDFVASKLELDGMPGGSSLPKLILTSDSGILRPPSNSCELTLDSIIVSNSVVENLLKPFTDIKRKRHSTEEERAVMMEALAKHTDEIKNLTKAALLHAGEAHGGTAADTTAKPSALTGAESIDAGAVDVGNC